MGFDPGAQDASIIPTDLTAPERSLAGFWIGTGVVLVLMMLGIGILKSGLLQPNQPQAQRDKTGKEDVSLVVNRPPAKAPSTELQGNTTADEESRRKREEEQAILKAIEKATVLQVSPVRGRAVAEGADDFLSSMRKLADNEFEFLNAKKNVYRSTFNQKEQDVIPKVCVHARNAIVSPGMYDFDEGVYSLPLFFWYSYHEESKGVQGNLLPETLDYVGVVVSLNVEKQVAEKIRNAFDRKKLAVTIWYRLKKVEKASWKANPHWLDGRLAHAIQFEVEILRFTYILDE